MVENARGPRGDGVARRTLRRRRWESGRDVVRHRTANRLGPQKYRLMAAVAIR